MQSQLQSRLILDRDSTRLLFRWHSYCSLLRRRFVIFPKIRIGSELRNTDRRKSWDREVGTILAAGYAVRVITTGSDASTESSTVTVHKSVLIGQYAYAMVEIDELSVEMIHQPATDPLKQRESFGWKLATVFKRQAEYAIVRIEHAVS